MEKIFWADLEMTGLNPCRAVILEFAGIITNLDLEILDQIEAVVHQPPEELAKMNEWNLRTHTESGLLDRVPRGKPLDEVETRVIEFLSPHFPDSKPILAGNSIHQDRKFIDRHMQRLAELLHYRMLDVSSFKEIFNHRYHISFKKNNAHKAMEDIIASIDELKFYLGFIKVPHV